MRLCLASQGATCYMNSCLQSLFHSPRFRDALYAIQHPTLEEGASKSQKIGMVGSAAQTQYAPTQALFAAPSSISLIQHPPTCRPCNIYFTSFRPARRPLTREI